MVFINLIKKYWIILLIIVISIAGISTYLIINNNKKENKTEPITKQLPLQIDKIPITFNIINNGTVPILQANYINNSNETITRLTIEVRLKDTGETIQLTSNEQIQPGQTATLQGNKAPDSGNVADVEILKYKISLSSGIYMEYDAKLKQYNWS